MLRLGMFHLSVSGYPGRGGAVRKGIVHRTAQSVVRNPATPAPTPSYMNGTVTIAQAVPYPYTSPMTAARIMTTTLNTTRIGYARCSTDRQDLAAQRQALLDLGVATDRIYTDLGLTGTNRARPGLDQALAAVREGDTLVVPKLDRLSRSVPDAPAGIDPSGPACSDARRRWSRPTSVWRHPVRPTRRQCNRAPPLALGRA